MSTPRILTPSRRGFLTAGGALGLGALLTACGGGSSDASSDTAGGKDGAWSFKDDRGKTVKAGKTPRRIVAFTGTAAALHDFGIECVGVFGPTKLANGKPDPQAGDLDVDKLTILGNAWGEFGIEKYAGLRPDLLVSNMFEPEALWYVPEESKKKILGFAPSVGLTASRVSMLEPVKRYAALAESLGADLTAKKVTDAKARFEKAAERLRKAAKTNRIKVMAASGSADLFYVSNPAVNADLMYFRELGVDLVVPDKLDKGGYFESLSWENADKYQADLIILDSRTSALQPKDLAAKPTWEQLPAVKAGQVSPWMSEPRFSYAGCAPLLEDLAAAIEKAKKTS
ncbi:ABC transporter substrate-binding protein [Streptomyces griseocarneus]|uniref:ABC transporter substrate-binding protein n=1 Tax=Streptomyces griseocarneus TaxID=51201 RepID=UPI00167F071A|nr:ABC transporter substrate-binding protein [Streptomyces griseocarneus]MBZ6474710.1 ABC transporter substrate-binding protein [Streptomyces griseocarneus]